MPTTYIQNETPAAVEYGSVIRYWCGGEKGSFQDEQNWSDTWTTTEDSETGAISDVYTPGASVPDGDDSAVFNNDACVYGVPVNIDSWPEITFPVWGQVDFFTLGNQIVDVGEVIGMTLSPVYDQLRRRISLPDYGRFRLFAGNYYTGAAVEAYILFGETGSVYVPRMRAKVVRQGGEFGGRRATVTFVRPKAAGLYLDWGDGTRQTVPVIQGCEIKELAPLWHCYQSAGVFRMLLVASTNDLSGLDPAWVYVEGDPFPYPADVQAVNIIIPTAAPAMNAIVSNTTAGNL